MTLRDTFASQALLGIAHQRPGGDETRCGYVLELISAATAVRAALRRDLDRLGLNEVALRVLVVVYCLDPDLSNPAELAARAGVTRPTMTAVVDRLSRRAYVRRQRNPSDRRLVYIQLTAAGREAAETALTCFLAATARVARYVSPDTGTSLVTACRQLCQGCA